MKNSMTDRIFLKNMVFHCHVGVLPEEKRDGQRFEVDVTIYCEHIPACETDMLEQTIDYGEVYNLIGELIRAAEYDLVEKLAGVIADSILRGFDLAGGVEVEIRKPNAPVDGEFDSVGVSIYRERS